MKTNIEISDESIICLSKILNELKKYCRLATFIPQHENMAEFCLKELESIEKQILISRKEDI